MVIKLTELTSSITDYINSQQPKDHIQMQSCDAYEVTKIHQQPHRMKVSITGMPSSV